MGKSVALTQGTPEWLDWRRTGIGGSDDPVVLGLSPFKTPRALFFEKTGLKSDVLVDATDKSFIFDRGHQTEKLVREKFQELVGDVVAPVCMQHSTIPFLIGSFDGLHPKHGVLEAKLVGKEVLKRAQAGDLPDYHYSQIQHLIDVSDADVGQWYGHDGSKTGVVVTVARDDKHIKSANDLKLAFWEKVMKRVPPELSERDYLVPSDEKLLSDLREAKELAENAATNYESIKELVINTYGAHPRIAGGGLKIWKSVREGTLNLLKIPEISKVVELERTKLENNYIEKHRGKSSESWTVKIDQKVEEKT